MKRALAFGTRHLTSRTVRARVERLGIAQAVDDERFRSHRARDNSVTSFFGVDRALSGDVNLIAKVLFDRNVVVMTVDRDLRRPTSRWSLNIRLNERIRRVIMISRFFIAYLLRPLQIVPVGLKLRRFLDEVSEIGSGKRVQIVKRFRRGDMTRRDLVSDVARTRMQHQPDVVFCIEANLDKVVSAAERSELLHRFRFRSCTPG